MSGIEPGLIMCKVSALTTKLSCELLKVIDIKKKKIISFVFKNLFVLNLYLKKQITFGLSFYNTKSVREKENQGII